MTFEVEETHLSWYQERLKTCELINHQPGINYYKRVIAIAKKQEKQVKKISFYPVVHVCPDCDLRKMTLSIDEERCLRCGSKVNVSQDIEADFFEVFN